MANILGAIGGGLQGAAQGIMEGQQFKQNKKMQEIMSVIAGFRPDNPINMALGAKLPAMGGDASDAPTLSGDAPAGTPTPAADTSTAAPIAGQTPDLRIGAKPGSDRLIGGAPTNQADVISARRALMGGAGISGTSGTQGTGSATPGAAVGTSPALAAIARATPGSAAPPVAASAPPAFAPAAAAPAQASSFLSPELRSLVQGIVPQGQVYVPGAGGSVDLGATSTGMQGKTAALDVLARAASQQNQQGFEAGQNALDRGQQNRQLTQQATLADQRNTLERDLGSARNAVEYAGIQAQIKRADAEMALLAQGRGDQETAKVVTDLKPYEDQLPTFAKFEAITPAMAKQNPAAVQQGLLEAFQTGMGGATFPSRLAKLAKAAPGASIDQIVSRTAQGLADGTIPQGQWLQVQQEVHANKEALRGQHAKVLAQDLGQYPMAAANPALKNRTDALFGAPGAEAAPQAALPTLGQAKWNTIKQQYGLSDQQMAQHYQLIGQ